MTKRDFLFELGTEELPPKSLFTLARAFADGVEKGLRRGGRSRTASCEWFRNAAAARRACARPGRAAAGSGDQAARARRSRMRSTRPGSRRRRRSGFAASCGVSVDQLQQVEGPKGRVLMFVGTKKGEPTAALLPGIVQGRARRAADREAHALGRWRCRVRPAGALGGHVVRHDCRRVRDPRHRAGKHTRGHRFMRRSRSRSRARRNMSRRCRRRNVVVGRRRAARAHPQRSRSQSRRQSAVRRSSRTRCSTRSRRWSNGRCRLPGRFDERFLRAAARSADRDDAGPPALFPGARRRRQAAARNSSPSPTSRAATPDKVRARQRARRAAAARGRRVLLGQRSQAAARARARRRSKSVTFQAKLGSLHDKVRARRHARGRIAERDRRAMPRARAARGASSASATC